MSDRYYKNAAIMTTILTYFDMAKIAKFAEGKYNHLSNAKTSKSTIRFRVSRNTNIDAATVLAKTLVDMIKTEKIDIERDIQDEYEFEFDLDMINKSFIEQVFDISSDAKSVQYVLSE